MNLSAGQIATAVRCLGAIIALSGAFVATVPGSLCAQTSSGSPPALPPTSPTATTPSQLPSANPPVPRHEGASIHWDGRLLQVTASGESLGNVLREIAARSNVHISGNLPQDQIYGTYGPAPLPEVLSDLTDGLAVNMLFVEHTGTKPAELTFTVRTGAASPPSAFASTDQPLQPPTYAQQPPAATQQSTAVTQPSQTSATANVGVPAASTQAPVTTQPADGSTPPTSPNGVKTPQEIFQQLQRLRANAGAQQPQ